MVQSVPQVWGQAWKPRVKAGDEANVVQLQTALLRSVWGWDAANPVSPFTQFPVRLHHRGALDKAQPG